MNRYSITCNGRLVGFVHLSLARALEAAADAVLSSGVVGIEIVVWSHYKANLDTPEEVVPVLVMRDAVDSDNVRE